MLHKPVFFMNVTEFVIKIMDTTDLHQTYTPHDNDSRKHPLNCFCLKCLMRNK